MAAREYWDVGSFLQRPNQEKPFFQRLGSALQRDDGGFSVYLNALPIPDGEGKVSLVILRPRQQTARGAPAPQRRARRDELDDEVPF